MLNKKEQSNRNLLKQNKPIVYEKITKSVDRAKKGLSNAIMHIQYDYKCNFKCEHCSIKRMGKKNRRKLTPEDIRNLSEQAHAYGLARFVVTGGEPLCFTDLHEVIDAINPQKFYISVDTNGWLASKEKLSELKRIGVDRIQLSLDSLSEYEHDSFRNKKGSWERAIKAIDNAKAVGLGVFINTVCTKQRLHSQEFKDFLMYINAKDVGVYVSFAKPVGAWEGRKDILIEESGYKYMRDLERRYNTFTHLTPAYGLPGGCIAVKGMITITQYGDVLPCQYLQVSLGNIFDEKLSVIIERGMKIFGHHINKCFMVDKEFVENVLEKHIYGKELPVNYEGVLDGSAI